MAPPRGFQMTPQIAASDEHGSYFIYEDRTCNICSVQLTTRNRYGFQNLCERHGRERDRLRMAERRGLYQTEAPPEKARPGTPQGESPDRLKVRSLLTDFLNFPTTQTAKDDLLSGRSHWQRTQGVLFYQRPELT